MGKLIFYYEQFLRFLDRGGPVVLGILLVSIIMWTLILQRYWFIHHIHPLRVKRVADEWRARAERGSWYAHRIREQLLSRLDVDLKQNLAFIRSLTVVLPFLGLLGTVTGMITSFEVLRVFGTGNARGLTAGISEALFTTLAGLITALSGLYFGLHLQRRAQAESDRMAEMLVLDSKSHSQSRGQH